MASAEAPKDLPGEEEYVEDPWYQPHLKELHSGQALTRAFAYTTSAHGLNAVMQSGPRSRKGFWLLLFLAGCGLFIYTSAILIGDYLQNKTVTDVTLSAARQLDFPAVTFCNTNAYVKRAINGSRWATQAVIDANGNYENFTYADWVEVVDEFVSHPPNPVEAVEACHDVEDFIFDCYYNGDQECFPSTDFTKVLNQEYCHCFTFDTKFTSRITGSGINAQKLSVILNIEEEEALPGYSDVAGARVIVHGHGERVFPEDRGISVKAGEQVLVGIRRTDISRMPAPFGDCSNDPPFGGLSLDGCKYTLLAHKIEDTCGCFNAFMAQHAFDRTPAVLCDTPAQWECIYNVTDDFYDDPTSTNRCSQLCSETDFSYLISSATFPLPDSAQLIRDEIVREAGEDLPGKKADFESQIDLDYFSDNLILVEIYFQELNIETLTQRRETTFAQLLASIGGNLGLFLGFSMLTIAEFLEYGVVSFLAWCRRRRPNGSHSLSGGSSKVFPIN